MAVHGSTPEALAKAALILQSVEWEIGGELLVIEDDDDAQA